MYFKLEESLTDSMFLNLYDFVQILKQAQNWHYMYIVNNYIYI